MGCFRKLTVYETSGFFAAQHARALRAPVFLGSLKLKLPGDSFGVDNKGGEEEKKDWEGIGNQKQRSKQD
jgi:hypothetical protein